MTLNSFTDITKQYETTLNDCTCEDYLYRRAAKGEICKHSKLLRLAYERARRATFEEQRQKYDVRSQAQRDARATARISMELALGW